MYKAGKQADSGSRILVVRLGAMGDIIHTLPAAASLKHSYGGSHVTWAVESKWAALLKDNPFVDRVVEIRREGPVALIESWRALRESPFDLAVDFQGLIKSALVAAAARPERIYGFHHAQVRERSAALFYSNRVASQSAHVVDRNLDLASAAGAASILRTFPLPSGRQEAPLPEGPFVLACPLAGWRSKQWPPEYYGEIGRRLRLMGIPMVVDVPPRAEGTLEGLGDVHRHVSSLAGLIYAVRQAAAVIGGDSGPLHLAAALGKGGVALFGPTDPARNGPYGGTMTVLRSPRAVTSYKRQTNIDPSMYDLTPEQVMEALREHLSQRPRPADCHA